MALPGWAYPPVPGSQHNNNYSAAEVVWTTPDGRTIIQVPPNSESHFSQAVEQVTSEPKTFTIHHSHRSSMLAASVAGALGGGGIAVIIHFISHW